jgi:cell division transport system permease protein
MRQNLLIQGVAIMTVALMVLLGGTLRLCGVNLQRTIGWLGRNVEMIVYLSDGVSAGRAQQISDVLAKLPGVAQVHMVTQREAYDRLRRSLGDRADLVDGVEEGLMPRSIEVSFKNGVSDILRVHPVYARLRATEGVEDVELMSDWVRRLLQAQRLVSWLAWGLGLLIAVSCVYLVGATIRLGVYARREEIEVLKLVGATDLHVEAPFLLEGALQGLIGAGLAVALLYGVYSAVQPQAQAVLRDLIGEVPLAFLPAGEIAAALGLAGLLGLMGSWLALSKHVRV